MALVMTLVITLVMILLIFWGNNFVDKLDDNFGNDLGNIFVMIYKKKL
jgi:hypothetical protein